MNTTAIILNWNTFHIAKDSIRRLAKEVPTIVVDNGSTDGSQEYFTDSPRPNVEYILFPENKGTSIARNRAIEKVKTPYFFLIDGDILYVPGSIALLEKILDTHPEAGCVGVNSLHQVQRYGYNGTANSDEAELAAPSTCPLFSGIPMAWTQYGLFRKTNQLFPEMPPFDGPGMGYEDSWYYQELRSRGLGSYFIERPLYYHEAHTGHRELAKQSISTREDERRAAFEKRWGKTDWLDGFSVKEVASPYYSELGQGQ